jgi:hypothetical protein
LVQRQLTGIESRLSHLVRQVERSPQRIRGDEVTGLLVDAGRSRDRDAVESTGRVGALEEDLRELDVTRSEP